LRNEDHFYSGGAQHTSEELERAEQLTRGLELNLEGDDAAAVRAQEASADLAPSAETLTFAPEQLATAEAVIKGEVTPKIIKEAPTRAELDLKMTERLEAQLVTAQIKGDTEGVEKAQALLDLHRTHIAEQANG
jgi:hypothetical protein